ncbi:MAG: hypothetical protein ACLQU3_29265 [Limisphaerales bacterium]
MNEAHQRFSPNALLFFCFVLFCLSSTGMTASQLVGWPSSIVPVTPRTNIVAIANGYAHHVALQADSTVMVWGDNTFNQTNAPLGLSNVVAIAAGSYHSLALKSDGTVAAWGGYDHEPISVPSLLSNVVAIAAGGMQSLALKVDGTVVGWGDTGVQSGLTNIVGTAAGTASCLALKADGTVLGWGDNTYGQISIPSGLSNVIAIAVGSSFSLALKADGTVLGWGDNTYGQISIPSGLSNVIAIAAGYTHSVALLANDTVVAWGDNRTGQTNVPVGLEGVTAVAAVGQQDLALLGDGSPYITTGMPDRSVVTGGTSCFYVSASGVSPLDYQWRLNGTNIADATGVSLTLSNMDMAEAGIYSVVASNALGTTSIGAQLTVVPIAIAIQPQSLFAFPGITTALSVMAVGSGPISYQWQFNGANLDGATNSTLAFTNITGDQAGTYSVVVSNRFGVVSSISVAVTVGILAAWGEDAGFGEASVPAGLSNVLGIAAGLRHNSVLLSDGTVTSWGAYYNGTNALVPMVTPPGLSNVLAVAAGEWHSLALKSDGTVVAWGDDEAGEVDVPPGLSNVVAIAAGYYHSLALKSDGTITIWGSNSGGQTNPPPGLTNVVAIAGGGDLSMSLKSDGTVVVWGDNSYGQTNQPPGLTNVIAIAAGIHYCLALNADGTVTGWGADVNDAPVAPPPGVSNILAICAGEQDQLALRKDGTLVAWGRGWGGTTNIPVGLTNVVAIAAGAYHHLALVDSKPPILKVPLANPLCTTNLFSVSLPSTSGRIYALEYATSIVNNQWTALPLVPGSGRTLVLEDPTANSSARFYRVLQW